MLNTTLYISQLNVILMDNQHIVLWSSHNRYSVTREKKGEAEFVIPSKKGVETSSSRNLFPLVGLGWRLDIRLGCDPTFTCWLSQKLTHISWAGLSFVNRIRDVGAWMFFPAHTPITLITLKQTHFFTTLSSHALAPKTLSLPTPSHSSWENTSSKRLQKLSTRNYLLVQYHM